MGKPDMGKPDTGEPDMGNGGARVATGVTSISVVASQRLHVSAVIDPSDA
jgi:hypothetical protein